MGFTRKHLRIPFSEKVSVTSIIHNMTFLPNLFPRAAYISGKGTVSSLRKTRYSLNLKGGATLEFQGNVIYVKGFTRTCSEYRLAWLSNSGICALTMPRCLSRISRNTLQVTSGKTRKTHISGNQLSLSPHKVTMSERPQYSVFFKISPAQEILEAVQRQTSFTVS